MNSDVTPQYNSQLSPDPVDIEVIDLQPQTPNTGGAIIIQLSGGTLPYDFFWEGPDDFNTTIQNPFNLEAGTYSVTVTDGNGCQEFLSVQIEFASALDEIAARNRLMKLSPVPASTFIQVTLPQEAGSAWHLRMIDTKGNVIADQQVSLSAGEWSFDIPAEWLPGVYLIMAESHQTGDIYTQRWLKVSE